MTRWTLRSRLIVLLVTSSVIVIVVTTTLSVLFVGSYMRDQIDNRLVTTAGRIEAGLIGLHGLQIDAATTESMAKPENAAVVIENDGRVAMAVNTDREMSRVVTTK